MFGSVGILRIVPHAVMRRIARLMLISWRQERRRRRAWDTGDLVSSALWDVDDLIAPALCPSPPPQDHFEYAVKDCDTGMDEFSNPPEEEFVL